MPSRKMHHVKIHVIGDDKTGVIAAFTGYLFHNNGNIIDLDQAARRGLFKMTLHTEFPEKGFNRKRVEKELTDLGKTLGMSVNFEREVRRRRQRIVVLVTREAHCLERLIEDCSRKNAKGEIVAILGSRKTLKLLADKHEIPFHYVGGPDQRKNEAKIIRFLDRFGTDLVVLAKYMRVLSPDVVWRYENRMINIHHSLLPAFPGGSAYRQAYEKGVKLAGCTAHYVTTDLDQGPIIQQEYFRITPDMGLKGIMEKGFRKEADCLSKAVKLHLSGKLAIHWGKVFGC